MQLSLFQDVIISLWRSCD